MVYRCSRARSFFICQLIFSNTTMSFIAILRLSLCMKLIYLKHTIFITCVMRSCYLYQTIHHHQRRRFVLVITLDFIFISCSMYWFASSASITTRKGSHGLCLTSDFGLEISSPINFVSSNTKSRETIIFLVFLLFFVFSQYPS